MELNKENLSKLWDRWIGSKSMVIKLKTPVNFLGSTKKYKESFLAFAQEFIGYELGDLDAHDVIELHTGRQGTIVHKHNEDNFEAEFEGRGVHTVTRDKIKRRITKYR